MQEPKPHFTTPSGIEVPEVVTREMVTGGDLELPAQYPFTRGVFADGYRGRAWTIASIPASARRRSPTSATASFLEQGQTGFVGGARPAHAVRLRPGRRHGAARDRQGRGVAVLALGDGDAVRRHRSGRDLHLVHHQRHRGDHLPRCTSPPPTSRACRAPGSPARSRTISSRNTSARGTWNLPGAAVAAADRRLVLYSNEVTPPLQRDLDRRGARARRGLHRGGGDGLHARQRPRLR